MQKQIYLLALLIVICFTDCVHDEFIKDTQKRFYDDVGESRLLQASNIGPLRIFLDHTQVSVGSLENRLIVKHCMDIAAAYFYNTLKVARLSSLLYPNNQPLTCNVLCIPSKYTTQGINADLAIVVGTQNSSSAVYVAKSTPCVFLTSTKRPIWGMILWNIAGFDQKSGSIGFQQLVSVGLHELSHVLAFSALLYDMYLRGTPLVGDHNTENRLSFPRINFEINQQFGCGNSNGLGLEDQDGTLISSHWQKHHVGNQFMIASTGKNSYVSAYSIALFQETGWYYNVSYQYAEKSLWGKNKGCNFLNTDNCDFQEFCSGSAFDCTYEGKQIGRCLTDLFTGSCRIQKYYTNTVCNDDQYELNNVNANLEAKQRGGYYSTCFRSDYRKINISANILNNRCYPSACSTSGQIIYVLIGSQVKVCNQTDRVLAAPAGLQGTLTCPSNFDNYCKGKINCAYNCNSNGICIKGLCLCQGNSQLTQTCSQPDYTNDNIGNTGGRLLFEVDPKKIDKPKKSLREVEQILKCPKGQIFDPTSNNCQPCQILLGCADCTIHGCIKQFKL